MVSLFISSKMEDVKALKMETVLKHLGFNKYSKIDVLLLEIDIL